MSTAISPALSLTDGLCRKRFTRTDVDRMQNAGILDGQHCELIDGELLDKTGHNPPHVQAITNVLSLLMRLFSVEQLRVQTPLEVAPVDSESSLPEPDLVVIASPNEEFKTRHPRGEETLLVVEVADTSVRQDLTTKRDLYARARVNEYWVLGISARRLIQHRDPADGRYRDMAVFAAADYLACAARPEQLISVAELLP